MSHSNAGFYVALLGLGCLLSFAQFAKRGYVSGPVSSSLGIIQIPAGVSLLWKIALIFSWWTAVIFVGVSLFVGVLNIPLLRNSDSIETILGLQPILGVTFMACSVGCWFI